jgi:hypothetical protein
MLRVIALLKVPRQIPNAMLYARHVLTAMGGNPYFASPTPPLSVLEADLDALEEAETTAWTRKLGATADRDAKLAKVRTDLSALCNYVERVAGQSPGEAEAIIASAGMSVKRSSGHSKAAFEAKPGPVSGTVVLRARAERVRASYDWQVSKDGVVFEDIARTTRADATVSGLTAGKVYSFRYRALTKDGLGNFSEVVSLLVP